jgi:O-methyltransferase domain
MSERTAAFAPGVAATYDFSGMHVIADIGGGQGTLLAAILRRHAHLRGILFDVAACGGRCGCRAVSWADGGARHPVAFEPPLTPPDFA